MLSKSTVVDAATLADQLACVVKASTAARAGLVERAARPMEISEQRMMDVMAILSVSREDRPADV